MECTEIAPKPLSTLVKYQIYCPKNLKLSIEKSALVLVGIPTITLI